MNVNKLAYKQKHMIHGITITQPYLKSTGGTMTGALNMDGNRIMNVLKPIEEMDVVTKEYLEEKEKLVNNIHKKFVEDNFLHSKKAKLQSVLDMNNKRIKNVADPTEDGDAVNKKHLNEIINAQIYQHVLPPNSVDWNKFFEINLNIFYTIDPKIFTIKGTVKIKQNVATKHTWIGNVQVNKIDIMVFLSCWHLPDNLKLDFTQTSPEKYIKNAIIDLDKRLIVYGDLKAVNTLHFNALISV